MKKSARVTTASVRKVVNPTEPAQVSNRGLQPCKGLELVIRYTPRSFAITFPPLLPLEGEELLMDLIWF